MCCGEFRRFYKKKTSNCITQVDLNVDDEKLIAISKYGINGNGTLGLSLMEMKAIKEYFYSVLGRHPYDIELESLAQTWSEHCKHNIFSYSIDDIKDGLYRHYIKRATYDINSEICVSVFSDNAGAIIFDDNYLIVDKVETHNSPSALDPFGGAITGILGVNRDIIGFGKGAKPVLNTYYFCFAEQLENNLYRYKNAKEEILSPEAIMSGVIEGVKVGGNCSGIPTGLGSVYFDNRFCGKPLVFVGSTGLIPKRINGQPSWVKSVEDQDYIVVIGGRVGRDGIHGATFSSEMLSDSSSTSSVQIGDPVTQKKLSDAIIKEARDLNLYNAITDNGAGGLSSSVGEMGKDGFEVELNQVLLKYPNLSPWEIWVSESQERMTLSVPEEKYQLLADIMAKHDVEISIIGRFNKTGRAVVKFDNQTIMDLDIKFLHEGNPKMELKTEEYFAPEFVLPQINHSLSLEEELCAMLERRNICSKEFIITCYDHEVQGSSVIKPIQGKGRVCADSIVFRPVLYSDRGVVKSQGLGSSYGDIDTYHMAACAIDTAIRNYVAVGGNFSHLALLDNFCWCDSYNPKRLWQLKRAAQACYDYAVEFGTPFISGKDSMFNDFKGYDKDGKEHKISAPPTLLISTLGIINDITNAVSIDVKFPGDLIYLLGITSDEMGKSEYQLYSGKGNNVVPKVNANAAKELYKRYNQAIDKKIIVSAIALNLGGLSVALAKTLIAGQLGAIVDLAAVPVSGNLSSESILFSESQSRILVTVNPAHQHSFESLFSGINFAKIGVVVDDKSLKIKNVMDISLEKLEKSYKKFSYGKEYVS